MLRVGGVEEREGWSEDREEWVGDNGLAFACASDYGTIGQGRRWHGGHRQQTVTCQYYKRLIILACLRYIHIILLLNKNRKNLSR